MHLPVQECLWKPEIRDCHSVDMNGVGEEGNIWDN